MNFQKISEVPKVKELLHNAFRKARMRGIQKDLHGTWIDKIRIKESLKLDVIKDSILPAYERVNKDFPLEFALPEFYRKLMELTIDVEGYKKALKALADTTRILQKIHKEAIKRIHKATLREDMKAISLETYGRIASVIKRSEPPLLFLDEARRTFRSYPDIQEMFSVVIYGFPNVGKSTLLNTITGTKAETAAYAFTTKTINVGYYTKDGITVQLLDVPGTLARQEHMNKIELQAQLVLEEVAQAIIYVFDISEFCGYPRENQEKLFKSLRMRKPVFVYVSKKDLLSQEELATFEHQHQPLEEIKEKIMNLAEKYYAEQQSLKKDTLEENGDEEEQVNPRKRKRRYV
ncbi:50S ribosome-binding GTPase [Candidatus Woesearchaeota archaeon]|nr:50S ribosome-binding GTPase [Candidatus Woesearchaeota archaeon]